MNKGKALLVLFTLGMGGFLANHIYNKNHPYITPNAQAAPIIPPKPQFIDLDLAPFLKEAQAKNLHVLFVMSQDNCIPCARLEMVLKRAKLPTYYIVKVKDNNMNAKFKVEAFPTMVVTDKNGNSLARHVGFMTDSELKIFLSAIPAPK
jgi:thioredoxin-related protein